MPSHFDRFRLLNGSSRIRNESQKSLYVGVLDEGPFLEVPPGAEEDLPVSPEGETILQVQQGE